MNDNRPSSGSGDGVVVLSLPFEGRWLVQNSPARRVPSHGTDLLGSSYAIDFVGVDDRRRTAAHRDWGTFFGTEPVERFFAYGRPVLAPADGTVVQIHDGEIDHVARRSQLTLVPYALGQAERLRRGVTSIAGNYVTIAISGRDAFVALVHLRAGSLRVAVGDVVTTGQPIAECGNSGNSTQPHLHLQAMNDLDLSVARGLPIVFRRFREWSGRSTQSRVTETGVPAEGAVVESMPS